MKNGVKQDPAVQVVLAGAVVYLDQAVIDHGVLIHHPEMPPFKLFMDIGEKDGKKIVAQYRFEIVEKKSPLVQRFHVEVVEPAEVAQPVAPAIIMPDSKLKI